MLYYFFAVMYVVACFLLLVVVLLQQGKGGDIAAAFGGNSSQTAFGARAGATLLTRASSILGVFFMLGALALGIIGRTGGSSVVSGLKAPVTQGQPVAPPLSIPATVPKAPSTTPPAGTTPGKTNAPAAKPGDPKAPVKKGGGGQ
jgi:preprotein translocase subunit SecG